MPANLTREDLLAILDEIRSGVASGDTLEGSIEFLLNYDDAPTALPYDVRANYRVGNLQGQGGMRMLGHSLDGNSNQRRIWVDGIGQAWIDTCVDGDGTEYVAELIAPLGEGSPIETIRSECKGLRLPGVTW